MWLSVIRQAENLHLNIAGNTFINVILESQYKDSNIHKGSLAPEELQGNKMEGEMSKGKWRGSDEHGSIEWGGRTEMLLQVIMNSIAYESISVA